ncbi:hypothetical protein RchiOBHm_Chr1g0369561 [Rosa chinensis]|uniref:Uncharacterized protein n=1 Tax=Rosa chinensis TaxID=74649 RepID=A0A2P6SL37_ROSCH|nr:hypothetical protein RchiOBHm_Chr1g0369561 [Rosa chinensis]
MKYSEYLDLGRNDQFMGSIFPFPFYYRKRESRKLIWLKCEWSFLAVFTCTILQAPYAPAISHLVIFCVNLFVKTF